MQFLKMVYAYFEQGRPNVDLEDQECLYLLGYISRTKTFSELVLGDRCHSNRVFQNDHRIYFTHIYITNEFVKFYSIDALSLEMF